MDYFDLRVLILLHSCTVNAISLCGTRRSSCSWKGESVLEWVWSSYQRRPESLSSSMMLADEDGGGGGGVEPLRSVIPGSQGHQQQRICQGSDPPRPPSSSCNARLLFWRGEWGQNLMLSFLTLQFYNFGSLKLMSVFPKKQRLLGFFTFVVVFTFLEAPPPTLMFQTKPPTLVHSSAALTCSS